MTPRDIISPKVTWRQIPIDSDGDLATGSGPRFVLQTAGEWQIRVLTGGSNRFTIATSINSESGGNVGADLLITRYAANGSTLAVPLTITRSTGQVTMPQIGVGSSVTGPNIRAGTGAASGTQPSGSIWIRTDGAAGSRIYVSAGGGTWAAIAGV